MRTSEGIQLTFFIGIALSFITWITDARPAMRKNSDILNRNVRKEFSPPEDSLSEEKYKSSKKPTFRPKDRYGDHFSNRESKSPFQLKDPAIIQKNIELSPDGDGFIVEEKLGNSDYRAPSQIPYDEFVKMRNKEMMKNYWKSSTAGKEAESAVGTKALIPKIYLGPVAERIFGGNSIDIKPNGQVMLDLGYRFQRTENPSIPIRQQSVGNLFFDQNIAFNVAGKIGERLRINANWDTKATFDFDNNIKVQYKSQEEDIIQNVEAGNVSMPLGTSLIQGAQNLFGIKTQMRFGKLFVQAIVAQQRGKVDEIVQKGGAGGGLAREIEIKSDNYDDNRHYFLSHFFRDNYEKSLRGLPNIISGVTVGEVEVYVTNRINATQNLRSVLALTDLGDPTARYSSLADSSNYFSALLPDSLKTTNNFSNNIFSNFFKDPNIRNPDNVISAIENKQFQRARDYEVVRSARKLELGKDYIVNKQLGYISLVTPMRNDDVLAVAYQYSFRGQQNTVGTLANSNSVLPTENLILKLIRPSIINPALPLWDLQMKNIYSLNQPNLNSKGFQCRIIYRDDLSGVDNPSLPTGQGRKLNNEPLVRVFNADKLNMNGDPQPDGSLDFVVGVTIDTTLGRIILPVLEPFGATIINKFDPIVDRDLVDKYPFTELYRKTKPDAMQVALKNKFFLKIRSQSGGSADILLNGLNVQENSVTVIVGATTLKSGTDYQVLGDRVRITNAGVLASGNDIRVRFERSDLFNMRSKGLVGTRLEYRQSKDFTLGASIFNLTERPLQRRVQIGDESVSNSVFGLDAVYKKESRLITKVIDALPLISTKEKSSVSLVGEMAALTPHANPFIPGNGTSFVEDFEAQETPIGLGSSPGGYLRWLIGSPPTNSSSIGTFLNPSDLNDQKKVLNINNKRARLAWYNIDNTFYQGSGSGSAANLSAIDMQNHFVRIISPQEIFPNRDVQQGVQNEVTFDLAYYPQEKGQYNFSTQIDNSGLLTNPKENFGAITRATPSNTDFDDANIQYLEFWLMDPFPNGDLGKIIDGRLNKNNTTGGKLVFHVGNVNEDVMKDGKQAFENGLPKNDSIFASGTDTSAWGRVTKRPYLVNAFDNEPNSRPFQDVGLDGLNNTREKEFFKNYVSQIENSTLSQDLKNQILADPSNDNFIHYLNPQYEGQDKKILERYKFFNGSENNSPVNPQNGIVQSSYTTPDNEDLNLNNVVDNLEQYYQYTIDLKPNTNWDVGKNYIVSKVAANTPSGTINWYQFRIPLRDKPEPVNGMSSFKTIRFLRTVLTGFEEPIVLRMARFQFVGGTWRVVPDSLDLTEKGLFLGPQEPASFNVSSVNVEENGKDAGLGIPYVVPPGSWREVDVTSIQNRRQNESSMRLCVDNLRERQAKGVFNITNKNFINYQRIKMFVHAQGNNIKDDELNLFVRFGTDITQNYYETQIPLKITQPNTSAVDQVWMSANELDFLLEDFSKVKVRRNSSGFNMLREYTEILPNGKIVTVKGNPDLSSVQVMVIGIKNPPTSFGSSKSVCVWVNEMRLTDFFDQAGVAALGKADIKLADIGTLSLNSRLMGIGYGSIDQKVSQRLREETLEFGIATNISLDRFTPLKWGIKLPMFISYDIRRITPQFDPLNPDIKLEDTKSSFINSGNSNGWLEYEKLVIDHTERRSINFANIQKVRGPKQKSRIYDIENISLSLAYNDMLRSNINTERINMWSYRVGIGYTYGFTSKPIEPFKFIKSKYLKFISEFNFRYLPTGISVRGDLIRTFTKTQLRGPAGNINDGVFKPGNLSSAGFDPMFEKSFNMNRTYGFQWALTSSLTLDYSASVQAIIDEPFGDIDGTRVLSGSGKSKEDSVNYNLERGGRIKNFNQKASINYTLPLEKIPLTDFLSASARVGAGNIWSSGAMGIRDSLGNTFQNSREQSLNGKVDFVKLYNKVPFLKKINTPLPPPPPPVAGVKDTTKKDYGFLVAKAVGQFLMAAKSINFTYSVNEGTLVPGYLPLVKFVGFDDAWNAPGIDFILGGQDLEALKRRLENQKWISKSEAQNNPLSQMRTENINLRAPIEPFKGFSIQLEAKRTRTSTYQENFRFRNNQFRSETPQRTGNYNISFLSIQTAFSTDQVGTDNSPVFEAFVKNRAILRERLLNTNSLTKDFTRNNSESRDSSYLYNHQDVLIPSFIAAYSGTSARQIELSAFPIIPIPNWRLDYSGLTDLNFIKKIFTSITLSHSYSSTYAVNNYSSSIQYNSSKVNMNNDEWDTPLPDKPSTISKSLVPVYMINQVSILERFGPLAGINIRLKNNMTFKMEYRQERNLSLSMSNAQVTELTNKDFVFGFGFAKPNLKLPIRVQGRVITLKNEITFRADVTYRDSKTVQRSVIDRGFDAYTIVNQVTMGNSTLQIKPNISYQFNPRLTGQFYFDYQITIPRISTSFTREAISFGIQLRFSLS